MLVKGNAWLARNEAMEKQLGAEKWRAFLAKHKPPFLAQPVMPISKIPVDQFLALHDAFVTEFFGGDQMIYWRFGETSAEWALKNQLRGLFEQGEGRRFLGFSPNIYKGYFDEGELVLENAPTEVDLIIRGIELRHVYFEYSIVGFAVGGLRVLGAPHNPVCIKGFSKGDDEVRYRFPVAK
jgi:hypothetical protein